MKRDSLFRGTFILSISLILTKIIGLVYIIPYYNIIGGENNMVLFSYSYNYYIILLEISSAGIPLTMAKLISKYNVQKNYEKSRQIYKLGSAILLTTGILGFLFFFFGAEFLSVQTLSSKNITRYTVEDLSLVIRTLSLALPLVMISSGLRGLFQGHEIMAPSAISQFLEQLIRVIFMLVGTYFIMNLTSGNIVYANATATFSTVVGAIFSVLVLIYYYKKYSKGLEFKSVVSDSTSTREKNISVIKEILLVSIPFVLVSSFFAILTLIDQNTIIDTMYELGSVLGKGEDFVKQAETEFIIYSQLVNRIVMIAITLAPAFTGAFLPAITRLYSKNDITSVSLQFNKLLLALLMIVVPALVGMFILAEPLYNSFYGVNDIGYKYFRVYILLAFLYSIYGVLGIMMQAIDRQKFNVVIIIIGILFKYLMNSFFIYRFETIGGLYTSILTYLLMIILSLSVINYNIKLKIKELVINFSKILLSAFVMFIVVSAIYTSIFSNFNIQFRIDSVFLIIICGFFGIVSYFIVLSKSFFIKYLFNKDISLISFIRRNKR